MKKILCFVLISVILSVCAVTLRADETDLELKTFSDVSDYLSSVEAEAPEVKLELTAASAVLMEASTGKILYSSNCDERHAPASVTKVMTLLIIMEELDKGTFTTADTVTTSEHAASMGGTQIYLEVGEEMSVNDMIKAIAVPSANDATVAMAEFVAGSEEGFVALMNEHAAALGMDGTHFTNCTGLFDDNDHYTTAKDMAIMTRVGQKVLDTLEQKKSDFHVLYDTALPLKDKIETIAKEIYGADGVVYESSASKQLAKLEELGFGNLPVCMAKTQYSLSDDQTLLGRPEHFSIHVREAYVSAGAGFVVVLTGAVMTMPGLPKKPAAYQIDVGDDGVITGLF